MIDLSALTDRHKGEVVVILGNGPSISDYDLNDPFFRENITIGSNAIGRVFKPTYYLIGDPVAFNRFHPLMNNRHSIPIVSPSVYPLAKSRFKKDTLILANYTPTDRLGPLTRGRIYHGRTSGVLMLHIAYRLGFKYFFVLGIDGYGVSGNSHFYEGSAGRATSDPLVMRALDTVTRGLLAEEKFIWNLSSRTLFRSQIPSWHDLTRLAASMKKSS